MWTQNLIQWQQCVVFCWILLGYFQNLLRLQIFFLVVVLCQCSEVLLGENGLSSSDWLARLSVEDELVAMAQKTFCRSQIPVAFLETATESKHLPAEQEEEEVGNFFLRERVFLLQILSIQSLATVG